jgi:hypothetical protein
MRTAREALDRLAELEWTLFELRERAAPEQPAPARVTGEASDALSVVIVSRDQGRLVDATLDSVRDTLRPRELIVADAGGGLFTRQRLQQLARAGVCVLSLRSGSHARAANEALARASGRQLLLIEAGECLRPEAADAVRSQAVHGAPLLLLRSGNTQPASEPLSRGDLLAQGLQPTATLAPRALLSELGFDERRQGLAALELWLRAAQRGAGWRSAPDALQARPAGAAFLSGRTWGAELAAVLDRHAAALDAADLEGLERAIAERESGIERLRREPAPRAPARVDLGELRRLRPVSAAWGFDRGTPVDRHYIERFLRAHETLIRGRCLEIKDAAYTRWLGAGRVDATDVLDIDERNPRAGLHGDLTQGAGIPSDSYDCFVLTQTLHLLYDFRAALMHSLRVLKPGGTLLVTVPALSRVPPEEGGLDTDYWRFTEASLRRLLSELLPLDAFEVTVYGNLLGATAFLQGLAAEELRPDELDHRDPYFPVIVAACARKPALA